MAELTSAEGILFFDENDIVKEMTYAEFQAILDNYVPMQDLSNRDMDAVYVRINSRLIVTGAVFFRIVFDREGFVDKSWNIPLQQLADNAAKGPDLGAGPISLACYSQCPIEWHKANLWDPVMDSTHNNFSLIKKCIKNNSLGLVFNVKHQDNEELEPPRQDGHSRQSNHSRNDYDSDERAHAALLLKEQRLKQKLLAAKAEQDMRKLSLDHQERILNYQQQLNDFQQQLNDQKALNSELRETIQGQDSTISGMRDYIETKIQSVQSGDHIEIEALREHYESEILLQVEAVKAEYESQLKARDVELMYRGEREEQFKQELLKLQEENRSLLDSAGDGILEKLNAAGVNLVIYHPGVGHLNIPVADVGPYMESPTAYVAQQCGVNEHLYRLWLDHFYTPTCQHEMENGEICDQAIKRLDDPSQFIIGESDRCTEHKANNLSIVNINKNGRKAATYSGNP